MSESSNQNNGQNQRPQGPNPGQGPRPERPPGEGGGNHQNRRHRNHRRGNRPGGFNRGPNNQNNPNQEASGQGAQGPAQGQGQNRQGQAQGQGQNRQGQDNRRPQGQNPNQRQHNNQGGQNRHPNQRHGQGPRHGQNPNQNRHHGHHNQGHQGAPRPKTGVDAIFDKYENLMHEHIKARQKYFDLYYTADDNQHRKLEENFNRTLEAVRRYEDTLEAWKKEFFLKKVELYRFDTTYSENRSLIPENAPKPSYGLFSGMGDTPPEAPFEDPHYLQTQKESFAHDTEESSGSIDDYKKLKGLL